uniref:Stanniocalcin n=1 Tax=Anabas testudineus TaxID=64144 RepID=A0A7N6C064_ANATE
QASIKYCLIPYESRVGLFTDVEQLSSLSPLAEIQSCLVSSGDVGCGMFQCFNNSCEIQGLHHICLTLLHNAGRYDSQGKSFVKDALRCLALGLRQRFSCVSRRCSAVKEMVFSLQRDCYSKHRLCLALQDHMETIVNLDLFPHFHSVSSHCSLNTGELPADVWRQGQIVGQSAAARAVRATLGGAVQQLQQRLFSQPIGQAAVHHNPTSHRALVRHCSGTPAAANQCR